MGARRTGAPAGKLCRPASTGSLVAQAQSRVFDEILTFFKGEVRSGALQPGDRLISERALSQRLGVSRTSLREAFRALEIVGLLESVHGQGVFVRTPIASSLASFLEICLAMRLSAFDEFLDIRIALECQAVRLAVQNATNADIRNIRTALERMPRTLDDGRAGAQADFEFHNAIVRAAHNYCLQFLYEAIEGLLQKNHTTRRANILTMPGALEVLFDAHARIYRAIETRDLAGAEIGMRAHFSRVGAYSNRLNKRNGE